MYIVCDNEKYDMTYKSEIILEWQRLRNTPFVQNEHNETEKKATKHTQIDLLTNALFWLGAAQYGHTLAPGGAHILRV